MFGLSVNDCVEYSGCMQPPLRAGCLSVCGIRPMSACPSQISSVWRTVSVTSLWDYLSWECKRIKAWAYEPARVSVSPVHLLKSMPHLCSLGLRCMLTRSRIVSKSQWSALPTSAHSRGDGSLTGQGSDFVCAESREQVLLVRVRTLHLAQLRDLTYDRTNDISKGNLGTFDLDGALRFTKVYPVCSQVPVRGGSACFIFSSVLIGVSGQEWENQLTL